MRSTTPQRRSSARAIALAVAGLLVLGACGDSSSNSSSSAAPTTAASAATGSAATTAAAETSAVREATVATTPPVTPNATHATNPAARGGSPVGIKNYKFDPAEIHVKVGESVTWTNNDAFPHLIYDKGGAFQSTALGQGESFTQKFDKAGSFPYICGIHNYMSGTVVVA